MEKHYILFDHDGVLVDTEQWYFEANRRALAEIGVELDISDYLANMAQGVSCWTLAGDKNIDAGIIAAARQRRNHYYQEYLRTESIEIPGVENTLKGLAKHFRMGIVTTAKRADFELIHRDRNILPFMDFVLTVEDYQHAKPHPEPYLKGLAQFGGTKAQAIVVEDSARGLRSAVAAGIDCVIVDNEFTRSHDFTEASYRIQSLAELPALLAR